MYKEGCRFWAYTVEKSQFKNHFKIVYGTVLYYSKSRNLYIVEWDKNTPEEWIKWSNSKIKLENMNLIKN